jgi:DNA polymerase-3 subunit gamma/tau
MLGIVDPNTLSELIKKIINKDKDGIIEFLNEYSSFEAEMILDELTLYIQDKLLSQDPELTVLSIDRLFRVLADGKKLLQIGSSGEFVLSLTLFKMIEAMNIHSIDDMIHKLQNELTSQNVTQNRPSVTNSNTQNIEETESQNIPENNTNISPKESTQNKETPIEEPQKTEPPTEEKPAINADILFKTLQEKIYDRNYDLGEVFKNNITYISFTNNTLTWESTVEQNEKKLLIENWAIIRHFVEEIFGLDTKIKNIAKKN